MQSSIWRNHSCREVHSDQRKAWQKRNLIERNLFYKIDTVMRCNAKWGEWLNNWTTTQDPGFIYLENPLRGFKADAPILKILPDAAKIPFRNIGSTLPIIEQ